MSPSLNRPALVAALLLVAAFWPVARWYGMRLDDGSDEPMGLLALLAAGWFLWRDRERIGVTPFSLTAGAAGLVLYVFAFPFLPPMLRALAAILVGGVVFRIARAPGGVWLLLVLSLPVIASLQFYAGWPLRLGAATVAGNLLRLSGLEVICEGGALLWNGQRIEVDVPCSGVRMLWTGLFFHGVLAAERRLALHTLLWLTPLCTGLILLANVARTVLLFFKESGLVALPEWTHEGIGVIVFAALVGGLFVLHRSLPGRQAEEPASRARHHLPRAGFALLAAGAFAAAGVPLYAGAAAAVEKGEVVWPTQWKGLDLVPVALTEHEKSFAASFPGSVAVFRTSEGPFSKRLILRHVERATRKLHSSADCLRAAGCVLEEGLDETLANGEHWSVWTAVAPGGGSFRVRERLHEEADPGRQWTDVTGWFWSATLGRSEGPWRAVTVIEAGGE